MDFRCCKAELPWTLGIVKEGGITPGFFKRIGIIVPYSFTNSNKAESQTSHLAPNISYANFEAFIKTNIYSIKSSIFIPSTEMNQQHSTQHQSIPTNKPSEQTLNERREQIQLFQAPTKPVEDRVQIIKGDHQAHTKKTIEGISISLIKCVWRLTQTKWYQHQTRNMPRQNIED